MAFPKRFANFGNERVKHPEDIEIGGVLGSTENWREILLPLLRRQGTLRRADVNQGFLGASPQHGRSALDRANAIMESLLHDTR